ncbi:hypothetical protein GEV33_004998 [Tenebrio molitor]|uniref:Uncharacterized protein n=1 Tax=Tenebrio molitor TaxID=7067 RepID=A0A8J6LCZ1_TENMO|nr:hypothetical protein GEV33_004998 [Tenebrio molitor]
MYVILIFLTFLWEASGIWPPPYEIKLDDAETFVISELSESDDLFNDEDEMIRAKPPSADQKKYSRIHQIALRHNKKEWNRNRAEPENNVKIKEHNFDLENAVPWEGGFVDKNGDFIQPDNENVYYLNEMAKSLIESKIERKREEEEEDQSTDKIENYDYKNFRAEYKAEIETEKKQKNTLNFTDVKEDESLEEAVEKVVEFTEAKNCTAEEKKGIGSNEFCVTNKCTAICDRYALRGTVPCNLLMV